MWVSLCVCVCEKCSTIVPVESDDALSEWILCNNITAVEKKFNITPEEGPKNEVWKGGQTVGPTHSWAHKSILLLVLLPSIALVIRLVCVVVSYYCWYFCCCYCLLVFGCCFHSHHCRCRTLLFLSLRYLSMCELTDCHCAKLPFSLVFVDVCVYKLYCEWVAVTFSNCCTSSFIIACLELWFL